MHLCHAVKKYIKIQCTSIVSLCFFYYDGIMHPVACDHHKSLGKMNFFPKQFAMTQVEEDEEISAETEVGSPENWCGR